MTTPPPDPTQGPGATPATAPGATPATGASAAPAFTMYTTPWCGYCMRLKSMLAREGIVFTEIDIERDPDAADVVMRINGGNQTVPTVVFPDGEAMTNPPLARLTAKLSA